MPSEVATGVYRLGSSMVNLYLVEDGGRVTIVDCGLPAYWPQLDDALGELGRTRDDVAAVVLTHGDGDHVGFAERVRTELGVPVMLHPADKRIAETRRNKKTEGNLLAPLFQKAGRRIVREFMSNGGLNVPPVKETTPYADGDTLDVPGRPSVVHTPGHTDGHCVIHLADRGVAFVGDALCSWNPIYGNTGPQLMPKAFTTNSAQALQSLDRIEALDAQTLLFGHGEPWTGGASEAVAQARSAEHR